MKVRSRRSGQFVGERCGQTRSPRLLSAQRFFSTVPSGKYRGREMDFSQGLRRSQLSAIEAASREAAEEAGVAGSIEQRAFASYLHVKKT